jgi:hypothetical protein
VTHSTHEHVGWGNDGQFSCRPQDSKWRRRSV